MAEATSMFDYDLIVIGGGSGGLAAAKAATEADPKAKVVVFDFVKPTQHGTKWGLGGTCVNVGCIPKKLMHSSAAFSHAVEKAESLGHSIEGKKHDWGEMVERIDEYIQALNFGYVSDLADNNVKYINAYAKFVDQNTVAYDDGKSQTKIVTGDKILVACGGRPTMPSFPGAELAITSDDIFWWKKVVGKTLCVGASYISLECAGFMHELGFDVTVAVRSILLRGFDRQCSEQIGEFMERHGVRFLNPVVPVKFERDGDTGPITVTLENRETKEQIVEEYDTVFMAIGRTPVTKELDIEKAGVKLCPRTSKIIVDDKEQTNVDNIYAIGDCIVGKDGNDKLELTPIAIQAGKLLSKRLFGGAKKLMNYDYVPTTVFTPVEYGCVGLSQEDAHEKFGKGNIETYLVRFGILEGALVDRDEPPEVRSAVYHGKNLFARKNAVAYGLEWEDFDPEDYEYEERFLQYMKQPYLCKLVCKKDTGRVLGFHYVGPNAGEITQGYALGVKLGATKDDFDMLVGIHPTAAEEFTTLSNTPMESGIDFMKKGGC